MKFPNAYSGVKKIFSAEILKLIGSACLFFTAVLTVIGIVSAANANETGMAASGIGVLVLLAASGILPIIAFIINLVGLHQASKDEDSFRVAFWVTILAVVLSVVNIVLTTATGGQGIGDDITVIIQNICEFVILVYVVQGIMKLAEKLNNGEMKTMGSKILIALIVFNILIIVIRIISTVFQTSATAITISAYLLIAAAILSIINYIVYLVYLGKAKKMLKEN